MRKRDWDVLFSEYDLSRVLDAQLGKVNDQVRAIPEKQFDAQTDEYISATVAAELLIAPLELDELGISVSSQEIKIDVSGDPNRYFFEAGPHYVDGIEVTYHVPYTGDKTLFRCRPNHFTLSHPRAVVQNGELRFPVDDSRRDVVGTKTEFQQDISALKQWLPWVNGQVGTFNASLEQAVRTHVHSRRAEFTKIKEGLGSLGFPVRGAKTARSISMSPDLPKRRREKPRRRGGSTTSPCRSPEKIGLLSKMSRRS
jgi:hypothetical protein